MKVDLELYLDDVETILTVDEPHNERVRVKFGSRSESSGCVLYIPYGVIRSFNDNVCKKIQEIMRLMRGRGEVIR